MRRATLSMLAIAAALTCLAHGVASAQGRSTDDMEILREKLRADKKLVVATALQLTEPQGKAFWPVYNAYQSDMIKHYDRVEQLLDTFGRTYEGLTDEAASKLIKDYLTLMTEQAALLRSYAPRFLQVLPPRKVAQLYQIENKIRALVDYQLAQAIPLIK
jgi:hypothetical protein